MTYEELVEYCKGFGLVLDERVISGLRKYCALLQEWNQKKAAPAKKAAVKRVAEKKAPVKAKAPAKKSAAAKKAAPAKKPAKT